MKRCPGSWRYKQSRSHEYYTETIGMWCRIKVDTIPVFSALCLRCSSLVKTFSKLYHVLRYQCQRYVYIVAATLRYRPSSVGHFWSCRSTAVVREQNWNFILVPIVAKFSLQQRKTFLVFFLLIACMLLVTVFLLKEI